MASDPYAILGVPRNASEDEIKKAYRARAKALHPDLHPDDKKKAEEFKRVSAAFEILGDRERRARYDRGEIDGEGNERGFPGGGGFHREGGFSGPQGDPFEDLMSGLFGGGRQRRRTGPVRGRDVRYRVDVAFEDAVTGARRRMTMADGRTLEVDVPAGIADGQVLRLRSQGEPSPGGGPPGDAHLEIRVRPSPTWHRDGDDLRMDQTVDLKTAVLGGKIQVPIPGGKVTLTVPAGSNTGNVLRLRGKGVQRKGRPGNLYVRLQIALDNPKDAALQAFLKGNG